MGDPKMTARERLRPHSIRHEEDELGVVSRVVLLDVAIQIAEEHAAAAVKDLEARVAELERRLYESFQLLPLVPGDALAWVDYQLVPHVARVADEYAILQRQREAAEARIAELERQREAARALSNSLLLDVGRIAEAIGSKASEPPALLADAQALKARVADLEREVKRLRELRPLAKPFVSATTVAVQKAFSLAELTHLCDVQILLEAQMRALVVRLQAALGKEDDRG